MQSECDVRCHMPLIQEINVDSLKDYMFETNWITKQALDLKQDHSENTRYTPKYSK